MVRWLRWHCPPDTGFEIRALAVWGRARYLSVTEAPRNTDFHTWMGKKHFCFFQTAESGNRTPNSGVKGSGANHYPRAPALLQWRTLSEWQLEWAGWKIQMLPNAGLTKCRVSIRPTLSQRLAFSVPLLHLTPRHVTQGCGPKLAPSVADPERVSHKCIHRLLARNPTPQDPWLSWS